MKSQINTLRQLQELVLTRDEHHQTGDDSHLDQLNDSIASLQAKLIPQVSALYDRLYKKNHVVIAAMSNNCCAVCGMQVPIAQGQQVRLAHHLVTCSSCGRILFADTDDASRNVAVQDSGDEPKTGVSRFSAEELMFVDLDVDGSEQAIRKLAQAMSDNGFVSNPENLVSAALQREGVLSTAMGGMAFPHVRGVEGGGLTFALGVSKKGIDWDGEKVNIVVLSAIPLAASAFYLRLMSNLIQTFTKDANRKLLIEAKNAAALWKALCKSTRATVK